LRTVARRRRRAAGWLIASLSPLFRYDYNRDAYVLRLVGNHLGPVIRQRANVDRRSS